MSFFDDSSLAFLPSGAAGKDGKAYSIKPTDGTGDFTFSRGSNLTATRVGPTGLIEKGRENLLLQSNNFDTTWGKSSASVTSGQSGYDGSSDAWLLSAVNGYPRITQGISTSGVNTYSVYAKANTTDFILLRCVIGGSEYAIFDLSNGTSTFLSTTFISGNATSVGNGWYRISLLFNGSSTEVAIGVSTDGTLTGWANATNESIYIQDAQLEIGLAATDYIESGASTGKAGLLEDEPRFDYSGGATCPSLLLEPSRTNLMPQTEYFESWPNTEVSLMPNHGSSPEGLNNAYSMSETTATNRHRIFLSLGKAASAIDYCFSVFVKNKSGSRNIRLNLESSIGGNKASVVFDTSGNVVLAASTSGSFANAESFKEQVGDYWKYTLKATSDTSTTLIPIVLLNDGTTEVYAGDGASGVYIYGAQLEQGSYPTSYIPNHSGGTITRGADDCSVTGVSSLIGQTEGTMFFEGSVEHTPENVSIMNFNRSIQFTVAILKATNDNISVFVYNGGSALFNIVSTATSGKFKCAVAYKSGDTAFYVNGTQVGVNTTTFTPAAELNEIYIGSYQNEYFAYDHPVECNQALLFDTRLSNADLATLTTL